MRREERAEDGARDVLNGGGPLHERADGLRDGHVPDRHDGVEELGAERERGLVIAVASAVGAGSGAWPWVFVRGTGAVGEVLAVVGAKWRKGGEW